MSATARERSATSANEIEMRIIYFASGQIAIPSFRWLMNSPHRVVAVVTQPDRPAGRKRRLAPTPVRQFALETDVEVIQAEDVNDPDVVAGLLGRRADLGVSMSFGQKIRPELLDGMPGGCLNIHPSLLPKCRGAAPVNWTIIRREQRTGVTVFRLTDRMDGGPVLTTRETAIKPNETAWELEARLAGIACDALDGALAQIGPDGPPPGQPQDDALATTAPKLTKEMGRIHLDQPAADLVAWVNGLYDWPAVQVAYVSRDGQRTQVRLARASLSEERGGAPGQSPGAILDDGSIACLDGAIRILEIQPAGGRIMLWQDFVNGRRVQAGDRFESLGPLGGD